MGLALDQCPRAAVELAQQSLYGFSLLMMHDTRGIRWQRAPHHKVICDALERVYRGECKRLIINVPPRYSKTELCLNFVTWTLGHVPDAEFIFISYSGRLAASNSWRARELVKHEAYQRIFPGTRIDDSSSARDEWRTTSGGCVYATGTGGSVTGYGAGKMRPGFGGALICDDLHKADEARSDVMRENVREWFQNTLQSRCNSPNTPIIVIMQRLHEEDIAGWLLAGGNGEEWESIILPAITEEGDALWPEKHDLETLRQMEKASPYTFAGQYLQRPAPPGGGLFKPDEMTVLDSRPKLLAAVRAWDLAATLEGDYTAGVLLGRTSADSFCICDVRVVRGSPDEVEAAILATARLDARGVRIGLPIDPGQAGKAQSLYLTRKLAGYSVVSSPESGDKITRAEPCASQMNVGNISMVRGEWNLAFVNELRNFPMGKHDDMCDALSRAFMTLTERRGPMIIPPELLQAAAQPGRW